MSAVFGQQGFRDFDTFVNSFQRMGELSFGLYDYGSLAEDIKHSPALFYIFYWVIIIFMIIITPNLLIGIICEGIVLYVRMCISFRQLKCSHPFVAGYEKVSDDVELKHERQQYEPFLRQVWKNLTSVVNPCNHDTVGSTSESAQTNSATSSLLAHPSLQHKFTALNVSNDAMHDFLHSILSELEGDEDLHELFQRQYGFRFVRNLESFDRTRKPPIRHALADQIDGLYRRMSFKLASHE